MGFKIPAELVVAPGKKVINEKDESIAFKYAMERLMRNEIKEKEIM